jgi:FKBP-type peptidyl-prolyl cis-trans isomerase SlpA
MTTLPIGPNTRVTLHFSLTLEDGSVVDSNFGKSPASFVIGDGSLLAGFEKKLFGLEAGKQGQFIISPEHGFGQPNPNNVQEFPRSNFSADVELQEGLVMSFADASQSELPGIVKSVLEDTVIIDFNHPLAGRNIIFDVEIIDVEPAELH